MKKRICMLFVLLLALIAANAAPPQTIHEFKPDSLPRLIANEKGHPFVLVIWSLDCEYCQASLATLAQQRRKRPNLTVITLSTDSLAGGQSASQMRKKLSALGLTAHAWAFGTAPPEQLRYAIDEKWHGEMPRSYWFDAHGASVALSGEVTSTDIDQFLAAH